MPWCQLSLYGCILGQMQTKIVDSVTPFDQFLLSITIYWKILFSVLHSLMWKYIQLFYYMHTLRHLSWLIQGGQNVFLHFVRYSSTLSTWWVKSYASPGWLGSVQNGASCHLSGTSSILADVYQPARPFGLSYSINCHLFVRFRYFPDNTLPPLHPLCSRDFKQNIKIISGSTSRLEAFEFACFSKLNLGAHLQLEIGDVVMTLFSPSKCKTSIALII